MRFLKRTTVTESMLPKVLLKASLGLVLLFLHFFTGKR